MQANNQLGKYFIDREVVPGTDLRPVQLLEEAAEVNILPAINNLIAYFSKPATRDYQRLVHWQVHKYSQTRVIEDLMAVMMTMLNSDDHIGYLEQFGKDRESTAAHLRRYSPAGEYTSCSICSDELEAPEVCRRLRCGHELCANCIASMIDKKLPDCPFCRKPMAAYRFEKK